MVNELEQSTWRELARAHEARVDAATAAYRGRREAGRRHPVEDFLFTYYAFKPSQLRRWHPGPDALLLDAGEERAQWRFYRADGRGVRLDTAAYLEARRDAVTFVRDLLIRTLERPAHLGCFGLHEWAMVYRLGTQELRHAGWPLRLGARGTDRVVEEHPVRCSHYDAYRFFTPQAHPRNLLAPTRASQPDLEQPGCLHAGMDCYKWAYKLSPAVPSDLLVDCFELAGEIRVLDMRASPYDLSELGYDPVPIETPAGKAAYVAAQRRFSERSQELRRRLLDVCDRLLTAA
ncbi:MAG: 3-methyladenine DNA glycosylase [Actinomycetota bacterium]|nr:3-methyladenine DNA glycosylase [Actinomycetota bacterium]